MNHAPIRPLLLLLASAALLTACITPDQFPRRGGKVIGQPAGKATRGPVMMSGCDEIVSLRAGSAAEGTEKENRYIKDNFPRAKKLTQRLSECGGTRVDVVTIEDANGQRREIYFDASSWFGRATDRLDDELEG